MFHSKFLDWCFTKVTCSFTFSQHKENILLLQVKTVKNEDKADGETRWQIQKMMMVLEFSDCAKIQVSFSIQLRDWRSLVEYLEIVCISPSLPVL